MEERVKKIIGNSLDELNLKVDSVVYEKENNSYYLRICLDGEKLDTDNLTLATHIINPILDKEDLIKNEYILDIYGKSKGSDL